MNNSANQLITLAPLMIAAIVFMIMGIANHKKRIMRYAQYKGIFGPFKSYLFVSCCLMGPGMLVTLVLGLILSVQMDILSFVLMAVVFSLLGVLIGVLTARKAGTSEAVKEMFFAGLGTLWHVEMWILMISCFVWIFYLIFRRRDSYYD